MTEALYRPRSVTEIIDAAVQILRHHYRVFVVISAIMYVPWLVATTVIGRMSAGTAGTAPTFIALSVGLATAVWLGLLGSVATVAASDAYLGRQPDVARSINTTLRRFGPITVALVLTWLAAAAGILLLVVGFFYVFAKFALASTVAVLEEKDGVESMRRSSRMSHGRKWHILVTACGVWLIYFLTAMGAGVLSAVIRNPVAITLLEAIVLILVFPLVPVTMTVLYYDIRIRAEGYDVELLGRELSPGPVRTA